jgi:hypothetical protein
VRFGLAAGFLGAVAGLSQVGQGPTHVSAVPPPDPSARPARALVVEAWAAFRAGEVEESLAKLDEAKRLYPPGDDEPDVVRLRTLAARALAPEAGPQQ